MKLEWLWGTPRRTQEGLLGSRGGRHHSDWHISELGVKSFKNMFSRTAAVDRTYVEVIWVRCSARAVVARSVLHAGGVRYFREEIAHA